MGSIAGDEAMQGLNDHQEKIYVSVRMRPLNEKEIARNDVSDWECINDTTVIYRNNLSVSDRSLYPTAYTFDRVFRNNCSTRQVYEEAARDVALSAVSGINASIFAYGQTSSGKTFTMSGITEYTVADIYDYIEKHKEREFVLKFSAIEIYNESVRDLLSSDSSPLRLLDDPERGTVVEKLIEETLMDWSHFIELISFCEAQRQIGETSLNEASSRSHQILRLTIESSAREFLGNDKSSSLAASVNFVDLAGSERASQTLSAGARLKEGCHINRSLLTLGTVIRKLSKGRNGHIPFRDSKLTRILQSSLGGNARTAIICTLSPARSHVEQTRNTLLFASCAKEVSTNAQVNVVMSDKALVKQLQREVARLENELRNSGSVSLTADFAALLREKDIQIEKLKREVAEVVLQRDLAQSQIKDMLQVARDDLSSESLDPRYPKLRVCSSWDFENQALKAPKILGSRSEDSVRSFDASQYSEGQSFSSDENLFQLPDFEKNLPRRKYSSQLSVTVRSGLDQEQIEEQHSGNLEDLCKEVRCIEKNLPRRNSSPPLSVIERNDLDQDQIEEQHPENLEEEVRYIEKNLPRRNSSSTLSVIVRSDLNQEQIEEQHAENLGDLCKEVRYVENNLSRRNSSPLLSVTLRSDLNQEQIEEQHPENLGDICKEVRYVEKNLSHRNSSPPLSVTERSDLDQEQIEEQHPENLEDLCKEVRCIDSKDLTTNRYTHSDMIHLIPNHYTDSNASSPRANAATSELTIVENRDSKDLGSSMLKECETPNSFLQLLDVLSLVKNSPSESGYNMSSSRRSLKLTRTRSCKASLMRNLSYDWIDQEEMIENTPPTGIEKEFTGRPEGFQRKSYTLKYNANAERLFENGSENSVGSAVDEHKVKNVKTSTDKENNGNDALALERNEKADLESVKQLATHGVLETELKPVMHAKSLKDVGLDPMQSDGETPDWPSEFKKLKREIIQLWHACNVSLVHRTYFFLLFKGDPSDSIYMEVELRRLSFLQKTFSQGDQTVEDGRTLTSSSSMRYLRRERQMLGKQMQRRLSKTERENLYKEWGIKLNSKHRSLQLALRLWSETENMNHIRESAAIVVNLVGPIGPDQAMKEMFGLNFTPRCSSSKRRSFGWTASMKHIL